MRETWILDPNGKGTLTSTGSNLIQLRYHKVAELLVMLSSAPNCEMAREELAAALWPQSARTERMTSLRQCLMQGREALGKDSIFSDRKMCRLASHIDLIVCGANSVPSKETSVSDDLSKLEFSPVSDDLIESLQFLAQRPDQVQFLLPEQLDRLLSRWSDSPAFAEWSGWIWYWRAMSFFRHAPIKSLRLLEMALREGLRTKDSTLVGHAAFWLGCGLILRSEVDRADRLLTKVRSLNPVKDPLIDAMLKSLEAHIQLHRGNFQAAIDQLQRIEWGSEQAYVTSKGLIGLYQAVSGMYGDADKGLDIVFSASAGAKTAPAQGYAALAFCTMETLDLRSESFSMAEQLAERFKESSELHLELYTRELLLVRARDRKKPHLGDGHFARAKYLRRSIGLGYTAWDRERLRIQL